MMVVSFWISIFALASHTPFFISSLEISERLPFLLSQGQITQYTLTLFALTHFLQSYVWWTKKRKISFLFFLFPLLLSLFITKDLLTHHSSHVFYTAKLSLFHLTFHCTFSFFTLLLILTLVHFLMFQYLSFVFSTLRSLGFQKCFYLFLLAHLLTEFLYRLWFLIPSFTSQHLVIFFISFMVFCIVFSVSLKIHYFSSSCSEERLLFPLPSLGQIPLSMYFLMTIIPHIKSSFLLMFMTVFTLLLFFSFSKDFSLFSSTREDYQFFSKTFFLSPHQFFCLPCSLVTVSSFLLAFDLMMMMTLTILPSFSFFSIPFLNFYFHFYLLTRLFFYTFL